MRGSSRHAIEEFYLAADDNDWTLAIHRAQDSIPRGNYIALELGTRTYNCKTTLNIYRGITITGTGARNSVTESKLAFSQTTAGIICHYPGTYSTDVLAGSYAHFENFRVQGSGKAAGSGLHGIFLHSPAILRDVYVDGFSGNGLHIEAQEGTDNADNWRAEFCTFGNCGGNGIYVHGGTTNAGTAINCDCTGNTGYAVYDSSFLGNTYIGMHDGVNGLGSYYSDDPSARNVFIGCYTEGAGIPTCESDIRTPSMAIGGFLNPRTTTYTGGYLYQQNQRMSSRQPFSAFNNVTTDGNVETTIGGAAQQWSALEWYASDSSSEIFRLIRNRHFSGWWNLVSTDSSTLIPWSISHSGNVYEGPGQMWMSNGFYFGSGSSVPKNAFKTDVIGGINVLLHTTNVDVLTAATNATPIACTTSSTHFLQTGNRVRIANALGNTAVNGTAVATRTGASTFTVPQAGNGAWTSGGIVETRRAIGWAAAVPSSGTWYVGDVVYNQLPTAITPVGWICTAAGAPGTWKELERPNNTVQSATYGTGAIDNAKLEVWRIPFTAGTPGTADDVTIFSSNCPGAIRILRYDLLVSTAINPSTGDLRTASGGSGSLLFESNDTSTTGTRSLLSSTATVTVSNNGSLYFRRSDRGIAGELVLYVVRT